MREDNNSNIITRTVQVSNYNELPSPGDTPGERIRWARYKKSLDIVELAPLANLAEGTISRIENNHGGFNVTTINILSPILEQPIWFLGCFDLLPEKTLGQRIRKARLYHGMTKKEFGTLLAINEKTVRLWEKDLSKPSARLSKRLCELLDVISSSYVNTFPSLK